MNMNMNMTTYTLYIATLCLMSLTIGSKAFSAPQSLKQGYSAFQTSRQCLSSSDLRDQYYAKMVTQEAIQTAGSAFGSMFADMQGMWQNLDDVVDDFVCKRMGAGEQYYGKRKYNPSGKYDGVYNGMGRSDHVAIELARAKREEMELRKQQRLAIEQDRGLEPSL